MSQNQSNHLKKRPGVIWRLCVYFFTLTQQFLSLTVLSGLKYLTFNYITLWEKLFFLICFITATYNSIDFALGIVEKWQTSPVLTVINPRLTHIRREPFPAITICNMNQLQNSKVKDFDVKSLEYAMLNKACFQDINYSSFLREHPRTKSYSYSDFIVKHSQSCSHMIPSCRYGHSNIACTDLFREALLDEGMCCSFNVVHPYFLYKGYFGMVRDYTSISGPAIPLDWSPEKGYPKELPKNFYPRQPFGNGMKNGFKIILKGNYDDYFCSSTYGAGFKVLVFRSLFNQVALHNPIDTPNIKETGMFIRLGYQTSLRVIPTREDAVESLRKLTKPKDRQCYFSDEYVLEYFRHYTRRNCEMECDAEFLLQKCNCISFHMPLLSTNVSACHVENFDCVNGAKSDITDPDRLKCYKECLPNCVDLSYNPKAYLAPLDNEGFTIRNVYLRNMSNEILNDYSVLKIFFAENYYRGSLKTPYIGLTEFLSQVGGLMSLMMGFSIISLVEMIYYFIIKPLIYAWRKVFHKGTLDVLNNNSFEENEIRVYHNIS